MPLVLVRVSLETAFLPSAAGAAGRFVMSSNSSSLTLGFRNVPRPSSGLQCRPSSSPSLADPPAPARLGSWSRHEPSNYCSSRSLPTTASWSSPPPSSRSCLPFVGTRESPELGRNQQVHGPVLMSIFLCRSDHGLEPGNVNIVIIVTDIQHC